MKTYRVMFTLPAPYRYPSIVVLRARSPARALALAKQAYREEQAKGWPEQLSCECEEVS